MSVALIDGDIVAFRAGCIGQQNIDWGDGQEGLSIDVNAAIRNAFDTMENWRKGSGCDHAILTLSDRSIPMSSFRYVYHPQYKRNRTGVKPANYTQIVDALREEFRTIIMPRLEADDVMGIWATNGKLDGPVIVSVDKDMNTVPCRLFNPSTMRKPITIRKQQAMLNWMKQTLTGDTVDGYKGCPGIGEKKALALLTSGDTSTLESTWDIVWKAFEAKNKTLDEAVAEARAARILKHNDYNADAGEIRLWHPTNPTWVSLKSLPTIVA